MQVHSLHLEQLDLHNLLPLFGPPATAAAYISAVRQVAAILGAVREVRLVPWFKTQDWKFCGGGERRRWPPPMLCVCGPLPALGVPVEDIVCALQPAAHHLTGVYVDMPERPAGTLTPGLITALSQTFGACTECLMLNSYRDTAADASACTQLWAQLLRGMPKLISLQLPGLTCVGELQALAAAADAEGRCLEVVVMGLGLEESRALAAGSSSLTVVDYQARWGPGGVWLDGDKRKE